jgi:DNA-binding LacI/PurR family transcriptional regulator
LSYFFRNARAATNAAKAARASGVGAPPLSSIQQDYGAIGRQSAQLLQELVALPGEKRFGDRHISVPVRLVMREST